MGRDSSINFTEIIPDHKILSISHIFSILMCVMTSLGILGNGLIIYGLLLSTKNPYGKTLKSIYHAHGRYYLIWISLISIAICIVTALRAYLILKYPISCFNIEMSLVEAILVTKLRQFIICNLLFLSHWFMAVMSARSFIAIKYPILYKIKFLNKESNLDAFIMIILLVVSFITCFPFIYDKRIYIIKNGGYILENKYFYRENEKFKPFFDVYYPIEIAISITLPCTFIMVFHLMTWYLIYKKDKYNIENGIFLGRSSSTKSPKLKIRSHDFLSGIPLGRSTAIKFPKPEMRSSSGNLLRKKSILKATRKFKMTSVNLEIIELNCNNSSSSSSIQSKDNKAIKSHNFAVMAGILITITFLFSLPFIVMTSVKSEHRLFDMNCFSLSYMLAFKFLMLKHFVHPYLIMFGNPALRRMICSLFF
ncbi:unnamed protein product [Gordionus sp. m RMFG-2023]